MTVFDGKRSAGYRPYLDITGLRRGFYSDTYFENVVQILRGLAADGYTFAGHSPRDFPVDPADEPIGDIVVEAQYFNRRQPQALVAGVDFALTMIRYATGYFQDEQFIETWADLEVEAVQDGALTRYAGDPIDVQPALIIRGRYRDFALLETAVLGILTRATRVASNVYELLQVTNGKSVLFFPARFDLPEVQALDGYAYWLAVQRYNQETGQQMRPLASTDAQSALWGGQGGGTVPHALIACFLGDTAETMVAYARYIAPSIPRIALVDFNNDSVGASLAVLDAYWPHYCSALEAGDTDEQRRWTLNGVRLDTGKELRDVAMEPDGPTGVSPELVIAVRSAVDRAWERWQVPDHLTEAAQQFCRQVQIVASGGFDRDRIQRFEAQGVPVDSYGVGSSLLRNSGKDDYSMDIVRVKVGGAWVDMPKIGRQQGDNPDLQPVDLREVES
jgi:nicotinate phosphoribosyltransferase